jgi:hypothetical protein
VICTATGGTNSFSASGYTFYYAPTNAATSGTHATVYTILFVGSNAYVTWVPGF